MDSAVLTKLKNNKAKPCVSVIIPKPGTSANSTVDKLEVKKALRKAKELVLTKYGDDAQGAELINRLMELSETIDYSHINEGLGFFVSPKVSCLIEFPFLVKERVIINNNFEIRDVLYLEETMINYYVLLVNEKEIKLFKGCGDTLYMIKDENFPMKLVDDYEYTHTSLGSSHGYALKSSEKDKSIVKEQRFMANIKHADQKLPAYILENIPLIISGDSKDLGYFKKVSVHNHHVAGKIAGNYVHENVQTLGRFSFEKIKEFLKSEEEKMLERLNDSIGKKLAATGIIDVWKAAKEGKGLILLVEKDFSLPVTAGKETPSFFSAEFGELKMNDDAIDDIVETVIEKKGKVVIFENGKLDRFDGIAMILRY